METMIRRAQEMARITGDLRVLSELPCTAHILLGWPLLTKLKTESIDNSKGLQSETLPFLIMILTG